MTAPLTDRIRAVLALADADMQLAARACDMAGHCMLNDITEAAPPDGVMPKAVRENLIHKANEYWRVAKTLRANELAALLRECLAMMEEVDK